MRATVLVLRYIWKGVGRKKQSAYRQKHPTGQREHTQGGYQGATVVGKTHDKKAAEEASLTYPVNATLDKDTGFQSY